MHVCTAANVKCSLKMTESDKMLTNVDVPNLIRSCQVSTNVCRILQDVELFLNWIISYEIWWNLTDLINVNLTKCNEICQNFARITITFTPHLQPSRRWLLPRRGDAILQELVVVHGRIGNLLGLFFIAVQHHVHDDLGLARLGEFRTRQGEEVFLEATGNIPFFFIPVFPK